MMSRVSTLRRAPGAGREAAVIDVCAGNAKRTHTRPQKNADSIQVPQVSGAAACSL